MHVSHGMDGRNLPNPHMRNGVSKWGHVLGAQYVYLHKRLEWRNVRDSSV